MKRLAPYRSGGPEYRGPECDSQGDGVRAATGTRLLRTVLAAVCALLTAACGSSHRSVAKDVPFDTWSRPVELAFDNSDTTSLCNLTLFLRCNDHFAEDTLTVRIELRTPDSLRCEEPFLLTVPHTNSPAALVREVAVPYRRRVCFGRSGCYRVRITPSRAVRGVEAVGVDIAGPR